MPTVVSSLLKLGLLCCAPLAVAGLQVGDSCSCASCESVLRRPDESQGTSLISSNGVEGIDQKLVCSVKPSEPKRCEGFCSANCRTLLPKKLTSVIQCEPRTSRARSAAGLSLSQLSVANGLLMGCPQPQPCTCTCNCDAIVYGTPIPPLPPPPFATLTPPQLSVGLLQYPLMQAFGTATAPPSMMEPPPPPPGPPPPMLLQTSATAEQGSRQLPDIIIGPPAPPLPMLPPPMPRGQCPKAAGCNCFCPCRE